jgi:hypothetical protein
MTLSLGGIDPAVADSVIVCDGCDAEARGFPICELMVLGWRWESCGPRTQPLTRRRWLALCPDCNPYLR